MEKQTALQTIVKIAREHELSSREISLAIGRSGHEQKTSSVATKLFAYLGGIFVLAGICTFMAMFWEDLGASARIISTFGIGFGLYCIALMIAARAPAARASTPLFLVSSSLQCCGLYVAAYEFGFRWEDQNTSILILGVMFIQYLATFAKIRSTVLLFVSMVFGLFFLGTVLDQIGIDGEFICLILGFPLLCITYLIGQGSHRSITGFWYIVGSNMFFWGSFEFLEDLNADILFLGISCFMVYLSTLAQSRALLFMSCLALLSYIGYFTGEHFVDSLGWPIALIALGSIFIGISLAAVRLNNRYISLGNDQKG